MKQKLFKKILSRFISGNMEIEEESVLEKFDHEMLRRGREYSFTKEAVWTSLQSAVNRNKSMGATSIVYRVAAVLIILIGLGVIFKTALFEPSKRNVEWEYYYTKNGQKMELRLSDGSEIKLNSGSSISFPKTFESFENREVTLKGEAYFKVKSNPKPFIVSSGSLKTKVLGTAFNIQAYPGEMHSVVVEHGKVNVSDDKDHIVVLLSNEQAQKLDGSLIKSKTDFNDRVGWVNNHLKLDQVPVQELLKQVERWYGVKFVYNPEDLEDKRYKVSFKDQSLKIILLELENLLCVDAKTGDGERVVELVKINCTNTKIQTPMK